MWTIKLATSNTTMIARPILSLFGDIVMVTRFVNESRGAGFRAPTS
jgi:hypothetical protein